MNTLAATSPVLVARSASLWNNMLNALASPGEVFEEVIAAPVNFANWRVPVLLVCLTGLPGFYFRIKGEPEAGGWPLAGSIVVIAATVVGSLWSASVLWLMGRMVLRVKFSFAKTLEIVGLAGCILALGNIATTLFTLAWGQPNANLSLAMLAGNLPAGTTRHLLETLNLFSLWSASVLAIGLSKLSGVSVKEAGFWVFGYWIAARMLLVLLA